jgi:hypothetical protein
LKRQIQHVARWPPGRRRRTLPMAFFLLSRSNLGSEPGIRRPHPAARVKPCSNVCAAPHLCGGCCTLLLYNRPGCSNYASDLWS